MLNIKTELLYFHCVFCLFLSCFAASRISLYIDRIVQENADSV